MYDYPLPEAEPHEVNRVIELYRATYDMEMTYDEAKDILERVALFIYLTEVEGVIHSTEALHNPLPKE